MKIRFQADADFNRHIIAAIKRREPTISFQTAHEAGLAGFEDADVLALAASQGRLLVSHDRRTMPHFGAFIQQRNSPGLLLVSQHLAVADAAEELLLVWIASEAEEWSNRISSLPL